jgi:GPH family glycoside/pentoside/hexuronide:cation symporter
MLDMLDLASTLFYFSIQALPAFLTGISVAMSYISIMIAEVFFGNLSDRTPTKRWGRRKPYIMIGAPLMSLSFLLIFNPHLFLAQNDVFGLFIYALVTMSLFKVFYGMTMTPFQSWMPELTEPEERPAVSSWQNVANFLGFVVGTFGTALLAIEAVEWGLPSELLIMILVFIVIQLLGFIAPLVGLKAEGKFIPQPDIRKDVGVALQNRDFVGWIVAQGLLSVGIAMIFKSTFPYINDYLKFGTMEFLVFGVELLSIVFIFFLIYQWLIRAKGKRVTLQFGLMMAVISLPFTMFVNDFTGGLFLIALVGAGAAGYYLFPYIVYADFAHVDEILTGEGRAGFYTSFPSIPLNGMQAFAGLMWGIIFSLPEIVPVPGDPGTLISLGYLFWGPFAAIFILMSVLVLFKVNLDPDFDALMAKQEEPPESTSWES